MICHSDENERLLRVADERRRRRASLVNDRSISTSLVRYEFRRRYDVYFNGQTIVQALRAWHRDNPDEPVALPLGCWRISGGIADAR